MFPVSACHLPTLCATEQNLWTSLPFEGGPDFKLPLCGPHSFTSDGGQSQLPSLTERAQVFCLEDLLQGRGIDHCQLPEEGPKDGVQEHAVPEKANLKYQLGLWGMRGMSGMV